MRTKPFGSTCRKKRQQEVHGVEGHDALLAAVGIIAPAEADALAVEGGDAVVGDGHAMGVAAEVAQNMFGAAEGRLGIDVPVLVCRASSISCSNIAGSRRGAAGPLQVEQALAIEVAESGEELLAEDAAQDGNRQQEHRMAGMDPALVIGRQSAAGNDAVDMIMGQQVRSPGVQDGEEPDLCAEAFGIGGDFEQGLGTGLEQQVEAVACVKSVPAGSVRGAG